MYLVDGNNVMGQRVGWHRDKAGARWRLLREVADFARVAGTSVDVVFDGAPDADAPDGSSVDGVRVHYAVPGSDADSRIRDLVAGEPDLDTLTVVTSDRRLADDVRQLGAQIERSGVFRSRLDALTGGAESNPSSSDGR